MKKKTALIIRLCKLSMIDASHTENASMASIALRAIMRIYANQEYTVHIQLRDAMYINMKDIFLINYTLIVDKTSNQKNTPTSFSQTNTNTT